MSSPGAAELLIVLVIVVLFLGPKRLPSLGRQLGGGIREFRKSLGGGSRDAGAAERERASPPDVASPTPSASIAGRGASAPPAPSASGEVLATPPPSPSAVRTDTGETVTGEVDSGRRSV